MEEKNCKNCLYCRQYYVRYRLRFSPADKGVCVRKKKQQILQYPFTGTCPYWEIKEDDGKVRRELAATAFQVVHERIDELIALLKE